MFSRLLQRFLLALIHLYRLTLSRFMGRHCRFTPTCSAYGLDAIRTWGPYKGSWLTLKRIARCNPFSHGGFDPVPARPPLPAKHEQPPRHAR